MFELHCSVDLNELNDDDTDIWPGFSTPLTPVAFGCRKRLETEQHIGNLKFKKKLIRR